MVGGVARLTAAVHSLGIRAIQSGSGVGRSAAGQLGVGTVGVGVTWLGQLMGWADNASDLQASCVANCSHGECYNGTCFCEVQCTQLFSCDSLFQHNGISQHERRISEHSSLH